MGNQGNRVFNSVQHRIPRSFGILLAVFLPVVLTNVAFAGGCDSSMEAQPALLATTVSVRGHEPVKRPLPMRPASEIMVFAVEHGIDVTLEVTDAAGQVLGRGDSPIRRTGVQRVRLMARSEQQYFIVVTGKEHADAKGSVTLRAVDLDRSVKSSCLNAQRLLADADQAYAAGQAVSRAVATAQAVSSDKSYADAADGYKAAIAVLAGEQASPLLAQAQLDEAAALYQDVANYDESQKTAVEAARTFESLHDEYGKARARALEAASLIEIATSVRRKSTATDASQQASEMLGRARAELGAVSAFHAQRHETYDEALALNNVGVTYHLEGRFDEAIRGYQRSLAVYQQISERPRQAQVLANIALVEYDLGRLSASVASYRQILGLIRREDDPKLYVFVLLNSALANWASGNEDTALRQNAEALALARTIQDTFLQHGAIHNVACVYATLGDQTRALYFYRQALAVGTATLDARGRTASLRAIANILRQQGHAGEALNLDREALSLASTPPTKARITVQIAMDLSGLGQTTEAMQVLETLLKQRFAGDDVDRARALQIRAQLRTYSGDFSGAESDLRAALTTFRTYESPTDQFTVWVSLAELMRHRGATVEAFAAIDQALALAEEVRLQSANPELRSTLLQPLRPAFDLKISMLAEQYFAAKADARSREALAERALETAEQARARALADYQTLDSSAPGLDARLLERRRAIYRELAARRFRLEARIDRSGTEDAESQVIRSDIATLRQDLDQIDAQIGAASETAQSRYASGQKPTSLRLNKLPPNAAVVEYWLGDRDSFAWVIVHNGVSLVRLGATSQINAATTALQTALRGFGTVAKADRLEGGERLYSLILAPMETQLSATRTLIFAPDGALHYIPFATLRCTSDGHKVFLVENHDIAVTPSVRMFLRHEGPHVVGSETRGMLLVSDPVYDPKDSRVGASSRLAQNTALETPGPDLSLVRGVTGSPAHLPRLPGAAMEAAAIASLLPASDVDRLDGFAASREQFLGAALNRYRLIHVASHAMTDPEIPQASALILSTVDKDGNEVDGRVLAADFINLHLRADTVVLSGCDTALGKSVAGEGLIGLRYIVLARGARSVVSSLWPALDQVTAELMVKFYSALLHQHSSVIAAWSAATRATLGGTYADPGTWGAFMLTLSHVDDLNSTRSVDALKTLNKQ
jgi:CHAT domain-containing protein